MDGFSDIYSNGSRSVEKPQVESQSAGMPWWMIVILTILAMIVILFYFVYPYLSKAFLAYSVYQTVKDAVPDIF